MMQEEGNFEESSITFILKGFLLRVLFCFVLFILYCIISLFLLRIPKICDNSVVLSSCFGLLCCYLFIRNTAECVIRILYPQGPYQGSEAIVCTHSCNVIFKMLPSNLQIKAR